MEQCFWLPLILQSDIDAEYLGEVPNHSEYNLLYKQTGLWLHIFVFFEDKMNDPNKIKYIYIFQ